MLPQLPLSYAARRGGVGFKGFGTWYILHNNTNYVCGALWVWCAQVVWECRLMEQAIVMDVAREAMMTVLYLAMPLLGISLIVGLVISVFQATTSIQEQTLTFIPKLFAILVSLAVFGAWMGNISTEFALSLYARVLEIVR